VVKTKITNLTLFFNMRVLYLSILSFCFVIVACETESNQQNRGHNIEINQQILSDSSIVKYYQPFKKNLEESLINTPISYSSETYKKNDGELNSTLSNLFADATYEMSNPVFNKMSGKNIDIVLLNNGGIRSIISKGNISEKTAFELMPFENSIVVLELSGLSIIKMIDYLRKVKLQHPISGLQITLNNDYSVNVVKINGVSIENEKKYYVATTDYLLEGGDKMYFLAETTKTTDINYKMRDILIDYFKKYDTLKLKSDNRFIRTK
jgi:2',3'-cyclic-nucleotide 2'-phosphodiesterase (5'-nucleotidase family)